MSFLRWPTEDPRTTPDGHVEGTCLPYHQAMVRSRDGCAYTAWCARELLLDGEHVILRGQFWEPVR